MPRILKTDANLYPLPKGATVVKGTNRVYVNVGNCRAVSQKTGKEYTSHSKVYIGLIRLDRSGDPTVCASPPPEDIFLWKLGICAYFVEVREQRNG